MDDRLAIALESIAQALSARNSLEDERNGILVRICDAIESIYIGNVEDAAETIFDALVNHK